jgi:hypothetical protein
MFLSVVNAWPIVDTVSGTVEKGECDFRKNARQLRLFICVKDGQKDV